MFRRRSLTPPAGTAVPGLTPTRRLGGARREVSDRVTCAAPGAGDAPLLEGWALNLSRGGLRAILEEPVELGAEFSVAVGEAAPRPGRVVWIQEELDGAIVGVSFLDEAGRGEPPPMRIVESVDVSDASDAPEGVGTPLAREPDGG